MHSLRAEAQAGRFGEALVVAGPDELEELGGLPRRVRGTFSGSTLGLHSYAPAYCGLFLYPPSPILPCLQGHIGLWCEAAAGMGAPGARRPCGRWGPRGPDGCGPPGC